MRLIIALILFIPNLLWSNHNNSDDLSGINLLCGDRYLFQFTNAMSYEKNIEKKTKIEKLLPPGSINSNTVDIYDINYVKENREEIKNNIFMFMARTYDYSYMTNLEFILISRNPFVETDYNSHSIEELITNKNFYYLINRQKLSLKSIQENFEVKCKKVDTSVSDIYITRLKKELDKISDEHLSEQKKLKDEQKI